MTSLENIPVKYTDLISDIETGQVKIPQFQRKFVWGIKASAKLLDSVIKGYPIGTFIYWRTDERLRAVRNLGNIELPEPTDGEYVNFVLDGQQRLTSSCSISLTNKNACCAAIAPGRRRSPAISTTIHTLLRDSSSSTPLPANNIGSRKHSASVT